jgi:hypothetical protein
MANIDGLIELYIEIIHIDDEIEKLIERYRKDSTPNNERILRLKIWEKLDWILGVTEAEKNNTETKRNEKSLGQRQIKEYDDYQMFTAEHEVEKKRITLEGIIIGMIIDNEINDIEISKLKDWCADNYGNTDTPMYAEFIDFLFNIGDNITIKAKNDFLCICENIEISSPDGITKKTRILHGILHGILLDGIIKIEELDGLYSWMKSHTDMKGF